MNWRRSKFSCCAWQHVIVASSLAATPLSKLGWLKEQIAPPDRPWEEEKKDLEQQLEARQGPEREKKVGICLHCIC